MSEFIRYEVRGNVGIITLARPAALNAFTFEMLEAFRRAVEAAVGDPAVWVLAVTGEGRAFCAGIDIGLLQQSASEGRGAEGTDHVREGDGPALFSFLLQVPKPVIAAVNGVAAGGGFVLAMMCDMRFVTEQASFTTIFSKRGLIAEHGMSWLLPRQLGASRALDLLWSSRRVGPEEALKIGLADRISPKGELLADIAAYAADLKANASPRSIAVMKRQVYGQLSVGFREAALECEALMDGSIEHPDALEGATSFRERRPPRFAPLDEGAP